MNQKFLRMGSGAIYYLNACSCVGVGLDVFISGMDSRLYTQMKYSESWEDGS